MVDEDTYLDVLEVVVRHMNRTRREDDAPTTEADIARSVVAHLSEVYSL